MEAALTHEPALGQVIGDLYASHSGWLRAWLQRRL